MTPTSLTAWRARMGWTAKRAAQELGLSVNGYAAYERGWTWVYDEDQKVQAPRKLPKWLAVSCERLEQLQKDS